MKFNIKLPIVSVFSIILLVSCMSREKYIKQDISNENFYRTDFLPKDSSTIANISWKEFFKDPILQKHINAGLQNNLDIRIAVQNVLSAQAYLKASKSIALPTISVGSNYTFQTQSLNTQFGQIIGNRTYVNQFDITGNFSWEADVWGKLNAQKKAELANYLSTEAAHKSITAELVSSIAMNYYQLITFDEQKKIINETIALREKNLETTKALKIAGTLTEVAVKQSEALVYNAQSLLVDIDNQIEILENATSYLLGISPTKIERSSSLSQTFPTAINTGYSSQLLSNRPDIMQAEYNLRNAFELTKVAKANFYPTLKLTGSTALQSVDIDKLFDIHSLFANLVTGFAQPILNKRQIRTQYEVSLANKEIAYLNFRKSLLNAGNEVSNALKTYGSQDKFIALKEQERDAYEKSVNYSQELVNYGLANYLEVINASVNLLNVELNISNAKYTKMKANIELYKALGGGWR